MNGKGYGRKQPSLMEVGFGNLLRGLKQSKKYLSG
jgi:hypothetical protein